MVNIKPFMSTRKDTVQDSRSRPKVYVSPELKGPLGHVDFAEIIRRITVAQTKGESVDVMDPATHEACVGEIEALKEQLRVECARGAAIDLELQSLNSLVTNAAADVSFDPSWTTGSFAFNSAFEAVAGHSTAVSGYQATSELASRPSTEWPNVSNFEVSSEPGDTGQYQDVLASQTLAETSESFENFSNFVEDFAMFMTY